MKAIWAVGLLISLWAGVAAGQAPPTVRHVMVVSVDGLRPDLLDETNAPRMHALLRRGAHTMRARTIDEGYTLPSHVSMLTGVTPSRHGVTWNRHIEQAYPAVPTLFEVAKAGGFTTAMAAGKTKFIVMEKPGVLDWSYRGTETVDDDLDVARNAVGMIVAHQPNVLFVHLGGVDLVGHASGWGSPEQMRAIQKADQAFGLIEDALGGQGLADSTFLILTADHGGVGMGHPPEDPKSQFIPWIAVGPGVRRGFDLDAAMDAEVRTMATFATVCAVLGLDPPQPLDAAPILEILESR